MKIFCDSQTISSASSRSPFWTENASYLGAFPRSSSLLLNWLRAQFQTQFCGALKLEPGSNSPHLRQCPTQLCHHFKNGASPPSQIIRQVDKAIRQRKLLETGIKVIQVERVCIRLGLFLWLFPGLKDSDVNEIFFAAPKPPRFPDFISWNQLEVKLFTNVSKYEAKRLRAKLIFRLN